MCDVTAVVKGKGFHGVMTSEIGTKRYHWFTGAGDRGTPVFNREVWRGRQCQEVLDSALQTGQRNYLLRRYFDQSR
jgi:hypothetical protein